MKVNHRIVWAVIITSTLLAGGVNAEESGKAPSDAEIKAVVSDGDVINLDGVQIRGNKELPQILYIVPWQQVETSQRVREFDIVLHSLTERRIKAVMPDIYGDDAADEPH